MNWIEAIERINDQEKQALRQAELQKRWALLRIEEQILTECPFDYVRADQMRSDAVHSINTVYLAGVDTIKQDTEMARQYIWWEADQRS